MSLSVSVVIPTFNRRELLGRAVASAAAQLVPGDEIIIVDDGSTDGTEGYASGFGAPVRYVIQDQCGAGAARNLGVSLSSCDLVCFLDSDDEWLPGKLSIQRAVLDQHPEALFCFSNFAATNSSGKLQRNFLINWNDDHRPWDEILGPGVSFSEITALPDGVKPFRYHIGDLSPVEFQGAYVFTSTVAARRREAGSALRFGEDVPTFEDLECFGRLSLAGPACYLDLETAIQHGQATGRLSSKPPVEQAEAHLKIIRRVWGQSEAFRERYDSLYLSIERVAALQYAAELITVGNTREARNTLALVSAAPVHYRVLAALPDPISMKVSRAALAAKAAVLSGWEQFASRF